MNKNNRNIDVGINCRQGKCVDNLQKTQVYLKLNSQSRNNIV